MFYFHQTFFIQGLAAFLTVVLETEGVITGVLAELISSGVAEVMIGDDISVDKVGTALLISAVNSVVG